MRFVVIADCHFRMLEPYGKPDSETGLNSRLMDKLALLRKVVDYAIKRSADEQVVLVSVGDLVDSVNPTERLRSLVLGELVKAVAVGVSVIVVAGNHDSDGLIASFASASVVSSFGFEVVSEPMLQNIDGVTVGYLPWGCEWDLGKVDVMFAHVAVEGAKVGVNEYTMKSGYTVAQLKAISNFCLLGHYHKQQALAWLESGDRWIGYVGSLARKDFSERDEEKGFKSVECVGDVKVVEFHMLEDRRFVEVEFKEGGDVLQSLKVGSFRDAIIKVKFKGTKEWLSSLDRKEMVEPIEAQRPHKILYVYDIVQDKEVFVPEIRFSSTFEDVLDVYAKKKKANKEVVAVGKSILVAAESS